FFFFFQAEDGIRDFHVTGVQTCALPISKLQGNIANHKLIYPPSRRKAVFFQFCGPDTNLELRAGTEKVHVKGEFSARTLITGARSEERRVGKEGRSRCSRGG